MTNKAAALRELMQAQWPGATVSARGKNFIQHQHPSDPNKFALDTGSGRIHYGPTQDQEIDTAWENFVQAPYNWRMVLADYNAFWTGQAFDAGMPWRFQNPTTGDFIDFEPAPNVQWSNDLNQLENVGLAKQGISGAISDNVISFPAAYGTGIDYEFRLNGTRLTKVLTLQTAPAPPPTFITDQPNPVLLVTMEIQRSAGVEVWVDGVRWTEGNGQGRAVSTVNTVEFRDSAGTPLWFIPKLWVHDSDDERTAFPDVAVRFRRSGSTYFVEFRVLWSWLQTAVYPVYIDPTLDVDATSSAHDAYELDDSTGFNSTGTFIIIRSNSSASARANGGVWLDMSSGPNQGDTIDVCYGKVTANGTANDDMDAFVAFENVDNATDFGETADVTDRTAGMTSTVLWTAGSLGTAEVNSPSLVTPMQELVDRAGYAKDGAVLLYDGDSTGTSQFRAVSIDDASGGEPGLHVEWTAAGGGRTTKNTDTYGLGIAAGVSRTIKTAGL